MIKKPLEYRIARGHQLFEISYTCFEILLEIHPEFKILSRETIQNQEVYERCQVNLYYRIQLYVRSHIKPGVVGKKPHKTWSCMKVHTVAT